MKNELQILIDELQKEHDYLKNEMDMCVHELDFLGAEAFKNPFLDTRDKLRVLKNLENANFDRIEQLKFRIENNTKRLEMTGLPEKWVARYKAEIPKLKEELLQLEQAKRTAHYDNDQLMMCLENIIANKIKAFQIEFEQSAIFIQISKQSSDLNIEILRTDDNALDHSIGHSQLAKLKKLGFILNEKNAIKIIEELQKSDIHQIITVLSKVTFEILGLSENQTAVLKYKTDVAL